jgi:hypothetical protein
VPRGNSTPTVCQARDSSDTPTPPAAAPPMTMNRIAMSRVPYLPARCWSATPARATEAVTSAKDGSSAHRWPQGTAPVSPAAAPVISATSTEKPRMIAMRPCTAARWVKENNIVAIRYPPISVGSISSPITAPVRSDVGSGATTVVVVGWASFFAASSNAPRT